VTEAGLPNTSSVFSLLSSFASWLLNFRPPPPPYDFQHFFAVADPIPVRPATDPWRWDPYGSSATGRIDAPTVHFDVTSEINEAGRDVFPFEQPSSPPLAAVPARSRSSSQRSSPGRQVAEFILSEERRPQESGSVAISNGSDEVRGPHPFESGCTRDEATTLGTQVEARHAGLVPAFLGVENRQQSRRNSGPTAKQRSASSESTSASNPVAWHNQGRPSSSVQSSQHDSRTFHSRPGDRVVSSNSPHPQRRTFQPHDDRKDEAPFPSLSRDKDMERTLPQARSPGPSGSVRGGRLVTPGGVFSSRQAPDQRWTSRHNNSLPVEPAGFSRVPRHTKGDDPLVRFSLRDKPVSTHCSLPLAVKNVPPLKLDAIIKLQQDPAEHRELRQLVGRLSKNFHESLSCKRVVYSCHLPQRDLDLIMDAGLLEPAKQRDIFCFVRLFTVDQPSKRTRRLIAHPPEVNSCWPYQQSRFIGDVLGAVTQLSRPVWSVCFDLKGAFNQVALPLQTRNYYGAIVNGRTFRLTRLPMGMSGSPEIMAALVHTLAAAAAEEFEVEFFAYVDNVRFIGSLTAVEQVSEKFRTHCKNCNVALNEESCNTPHQSGEFLGMFFDYAALTVRLADRIPAKLPTMSRFSVADFRRYIGVLHYSARVLRIPLCDFYYAIKFVCRRCHQLSLGLILESDPVSVWPSSKSQFAAWEAVIFRNSPVSTFVSSSSERPLTLFTDASLSGWGAVAVDGFTLRQFGGKWPSVKTDILEAEALAVHHGLRSVIFCGSNIRLLVDNTSVSFTLVKGRSREFALNSVLQVTLRLIDLYDATVTVAYVPTADNPADAISRGSFSSVQLSPVARALVGVAGRRVATPVF
jgi:hypothetical protein